MQAGSPLCVVHGPFGTGKSMLLVAAIHFLLGQRSSEGALKGCRIAVAAHTNAAVDRVMCGLLESGVTGARIITLDQLSILTLLRFIVMSCAAVSPPSATAAVLDMRYPTRMQARTPCGLGEGGCVQA